MADPLSQILAGKGRKVRRATDKLHVIRLQHPRTGQDSGRAENFVMVRLFAFKARGEIHFLLWAISFPEFDRHFPLPSLVVFHRLRRNFAFTRYEDYSRPLLRKWADRKSKLPPPYRRVGSQALVGDEHDEHGRVLTG